MYAIGFKVNAFQNFKKIQNQKGIYSKFNVIIGKKNVFQNLAINSKEMKIA